MLSCDIIGTYVCGMLFFYYFIVPTPNPPMILAPIRQTDSISITWSQAPEGVVQSYQISYTYDGPCPNVTGSVPVTLNGTATTYEVSGLEEFSSYTITVIAVNPAGMAEASVTATTLFTSTYL